MKYKMMAFLSRYMLSCEEAGYLISRSYDEKLSFRKKLDLRLHLVSCYLCRRYEKQLTRLNDAVIQYRETCDHKDCQHAMIPEVKTRISQHVKKELKAGG